jgi:hypothetical protein
LYTDLMFGFQLQKIAQKSGFRFATIRPASKVPRGDVLIVDLAVRGDWVQAIRQAHEQGIPAVAFGPHMDSDARRKAKQAGAWRVLANSNLARDLPLILSNLKNGNGKPTPERNESTE